jgi:hypothetical protein
VPATKGTSMTEQPIDQDSYLRQRPRSMAEELDGVTDPSFADLAQPQINPSAQQHAQRRAANDAEVRRDRDLEVVDRAARDEADDLALAKATRLRRDRQPVPAGVLARAARAARARGTSMSSAEIMAARAGRG